MCNLFDFWEKVWEKDRMIEAPRYRWPTNPAKLTRNVQSKRDLRLALWVLFEQPQLAEGLAPLDRGRYRPESYTATNDQRCQ